VPEAALSISSSSYCAADTADRALISRDSPLPGDRGGRCSRHRQTV